jgi:hypothetical protein
VGNPAHVYVHAIALRLRQRFPSKEAPGAQCSLPEAAEGDAVAHVVLRIGKQEHPLEFALEQGRYKLTRAPLGRAGRRSFLERHKKQGPQKPWKPSLR